MPVDRGTGQMSRARGGRRRLASRIAAGPQETRMMPRTEMLAGRSTRLTIKPDRLPTLADELALQAVATNTRERRPAR